MGGIEAGAMSSFDTNIIAGAPQSFLNGLFGPYCFTGARGVGRERLISPCQALPSQQLFATAAKDMPTQPTYPGVYVEETPGDLHSIAGVPTSASAFIGAATKGALNKPIRVRSVGEFEQTFGRLRTDLELGYAIRQFFLNGGSDAWIVRASRALAPARMTEAIKALNAAESLNLLAIPGVTHPKVIEFAVDYCARRGIFLLIDPPVSADDVPMMQQFANSLPKSRDAAVYFPRVIIRDPVNGQPRATAPGGTVAGMMARCDAARGV